MTPDDLDLVETSLLTDALYRRVGESGAVLVAMTQPRSADKESFSCYFRGGITVSMGLAMRAYENMQDDCRKFKE